jgi:hypothetical protein
MALTLGSVNGRLEPAGVRLAPDQNPQIQTRPRSGDIRIRAGKNGTTNCRRIDQHYTVGIQTLKRTNRTNETGFACPPM